MSQILPRLYLGDMELAKDREGLNLIKCTHILCVTNSIGEVFPGVNIINANSSIGISVQCD